MKIDELIELLEKESAEYFKVGNIVQHAADCMETDAQFEWAMSIGKTLKFCVGQLKKIQAEFDQNNDAIREYRIKQYDIEECDVLNED